MFLQSDFQIKEKSLSIRMPQKPFRAYCPPKNKMNSRKLYFVKNKDYPFPANRNLQILPHHLLNSNGAFVRVAGKTYFQTESQTHQNQFHAFPNLL